MEEKTVTLTVTAQEFNIIMAGLSELPHKVSANVIAALSKQVQEQVNPDGTPK
jgi:tetrahydromethanopterin S-methyltransferase subunit G